MLEKAPALGRGKSGPLGDHLIRLGCVLQVRHDLFHSRCGVGFIRIGDGPAKGQHVSRKATGVSTTAPTTAFNKSPNISISLSYSASKAVRRSASMLSALVKSQSM